MEWRIFGNIDPVAIKGKNCTIFRIKRKKFVIGRLEWCEVHPDDKKAGMQDHWNWVTDHGTCHEIDVEDRICVLPILEVTIERRY